MTQRKGTAPKRRRWEPPETIFPWTLDAPDPDRELWDRTDEFSFGAACPCCGDVVTVRDTRRWALSMSEP